MAPTLPQAQNAAVLTSRLYDADPDIRYMSLNDLKALFDGPSSAFLAHDYNQCAKIVDGFLHTLVDTNGEVQNLAIKCLGSFVLKTDPKILNPLIHKITELTADTENVVDSSIPALAVRAVVVALPRPTASTVRAPGVLDGYAAISKVLIPRLVGYIVLPHGDKSRPDPPRGLLEEDLEKGTDSNFIDVLTEVAKCFGPMLQPPEVQALQEITLRLLENERTSSIMKKKAVVALSTLAHYFSDTLLSSIISHLIESLENVHLTPANRKLYITILGAMARAVPQKFGPYLKTLAPFVLSALSQEELDAQMQDIAEGEERDPEVDDMREAALAALENFLSSCPSDMSRFSDECTDSALRFIRYDPNVAMFDEDDEPDEDDDTEFDADEDFEEEGSADDEDDFSWKVRKGAARTLHTIVSVRSADLLENAEKYDRIANALIARLKEREDSVRVEVLSTLSYLIRKTGEAELHTDLDLVNGLENSLRLRPSTKKRRRGDSDVSMPDAVKAGRYTGSTSPDAYNPPQIGPRASLAKLGAHLLPELLKLLKTSTLPTKQASIIVIKDLVVVQSGGTGEYLENILATLGDVLEAHIADIRSNHAAFVGTSGSTTATTLQTETLQLTAEIAKTHSSNALVSQIPKLIPAVSKLAQNKSPKVSCEGLITLEQFVKALTPPRSASASSTSSKQLLLIYGVVSELAQSKSVDLAVRRQALQIIGTLLGRTLGTGGAKLIPGKERAEALELLYDSLRNETSRHAAIKAIDAVADFVPSKADFDQDWYGKVILELGAQLRKADRALRGASLKALRTLTSISPNVQILDETMYKQLVELLLPLLSTEDLHLVGPALLVLAALLENSSINVVDSAFNNQICQLLLGSAAAQVVNQLTALITAIGARKVGKPLMQMLLKDVGINGSPTVVGKVIGTLLITGEASVGVRVEDFLHELKQATDGRRKCLALSILGEVGHRSGGSGRLSPDLFVSHFKADYEEVGIAAAVALGQVATGNGNLGTYLSAILERAHSHPDQQYLVLHSIKEILVDHQTLGQQLTPFTNSLWETAMTASQSEDSRTIGAECISSLTIMDPTTFLPTLQVITPSTFFK